MRLVKLLNKQKSFIQKNPRLIKFGLQVLVPIQTDIYLQPFALKLIMNRLLKKVNYFSSIRDKIKRERESRLGKVGQNVLPTRTVDSLALIRNIGIIAHIDAGKTTTTERMLYYAGALPSPGNIQQGNTTMDYLKQQKQRGITIRSAAISFNWNKCQINLIDTPGHVDFSGEVTRSLRVLDGAVTILDGGKGVEAQTVKVWRQAEKRGTPKICFINKLDRIGSSVQRTAEAIQALLNVEPLAFQMPVGQGEHFKGVIDLIRMQQITFGGPFGENVASAEVTRNHPLFEQAVKKRDLLIQRIANYDDVVGDLYLNEQKITVPILKTAIRRMLNTPSVYQKVTPLFLGAAYKNKGVQPLLDAIVDYLPSPTERPPVVSSLDSSLIRRPIRAESFAAYTFKVIVDKQYGVLAYTRIYSGQLKKNSSVLNSSKGVVEKATQIYRVRANQYVPVNEVYAGDIVAIAGFSQTKAGDTLTSSGDSQFMLQKLELPAAIFTAPLELRETRKEKDFLEAINKVILEDNSLVFKEEQETGQFLLSGLGQLHLQVVKDKLVEDGFDVRLGNLKIGFRETIREPAQKTLMLRTELKNGNYEQFELTLQIVPLREENGQIEDKVLISFTFPKVDGFDDNWREFIARKEFSKSDRRKQNQTKETDSQGRTPAKRSFRNPTPIEPLVEEQKEGQKEQGVSLIHQQEADENEPEQEEQDTNQPQEEEQEPYYHINTLPFDTLDELVEQCRVASYSGCNGYPMMGLQLRICGGKFQKKHFNKALMNKTASQLTRQLLESSTLIEPVLEFQLEGESSMIEEVTSDILLKRRGRIEEQTQNALRGFIPAASVRGWIKELRVMGLEVDMKLAGYEDVIGIDPKKLLQDNR